MLGSAPDKKNAIRMSVWNVMYSMDIIQKNSIKFPSERKFISEDIIWDSDYYKYSQKAIVIDSTSYNYRTTPGSLTQKYKPDMLKKICVLYNYLYKKLGADNNKIVRLQRQFFVNLRTCFSQEHSSMSNKNVKEIITTIKKIVNNDIVQIVSAEYLKVIDQPKQKLFVWLVNHKCVMLLYLLIIMRGL